MEPKNHVVKLWGKQEIKDGCTYRMMRYVLSADYNGNKLLHNVVTGQLVVLDRNEAEMVEILPQKYVPVMEQLVTDYYLVPDDYDEHQQVVNLRRILWKLDDAQGDKPILHYTILPTTVCNARCYYCFEHGVKPTTMTKKVANNVVEFIKAHSDKRNVWITWFGGEPTVAADQIDQICKGLTNNGITFSSKIKTNGYLFDEVLVQRAKHLWRVKAVTITVDGTGECYNRIKSYVNASNNPYSRVLSNIGLLLNQGINVLVRMNFDKGNYQEFEKLLSDLSERYQKNRFLQVRVHQINSGYSDGSSGYLSDDETWYSEKILAFNNLAREAGFSQIKQDLPVLCYRWCLAASNNAVTILPSGNLVSCPEQLGDDQIKGDLEKGITNLALETSWKRVADYKKCKECVLFPNCLKIFNCAGLDHCYSKLDMLYQYQERMKQLYTVACI